MRRTEILFFLRMMAGGAGGGGTRCAMSLFVVIVSGKIDKREDGGLISSFPGNPRPAAVQQQQQ